MVPFLNSSAFFVNCTISSGEKQVEFANKTEACVQSCVKKSSLNICIFVFNVLLSIISGLSVSIFFNSELNLFITSSA